MNICSLCENNRVSSELATLCDECATRRIKPSIESKVDDSRERQWHAIMSAILECDPIPACKRLDDQLEPPAEVVRRMKAQLEEARKARDVAEAKGRWLDSVKVTTTARELAAALPPDILMAPMPFPDRLDYAAKIIQAAFERWFKA